MALSELIARMLTKSEWIKSYAFRLRVKRAERIKALIREFYNKYKKVSIIDIGGTGVYWKIIPEKFLIRNNVHITILNLPSIEPLPENNKIFTFVNGDGCNLSEFSDKSFNISHSNSVIEHVGDWEKITNFASEMRRVAEKYYLQTPNYWFPIEPHFRAPFFQWLPKYIRIKLIQKLNLGHHQKTENYYKAKNKIESCNLLTKRELLKLFPDAFLYHERIPFFLYLSKSLILIKK